jgi:Ras-related protein Rab-8A
MNKSSSSGQNYLNYSSQVKLLTIGDSGVGKSNLLLRFTDEVFSPSFITTIGIDFRSKVETIDGKRVKINVWDTAGQDRFKTITQAYYKGADGVMLVYDVTDEKSFRSIKSWMKSLENYADDSIKKILVANKCDLATDRVVASSKGMDLAKEYGISYFECSAKTGDGVLEAFASLARISIRESHSETQDVVVLPHGFNRFPGCASCKL